MQDQYILALDQGTTSSRAMLFDRLGNVVSTAQKEFEQIYPRPGWVEHDPQEIWSTQTGVAAEIEALAGSVPHCDGVYLVPAFAGLGAPHWNARARGTLFGVTRGTTSAHIARAALDSIAYQSLDVLKAMEADSGIRIGELRVDGGACANNLLMQFQADILGVDAVRPKVSETTALGAAYLAGLAVGYWKDVDELQSQWKLDRRFTPAREQADVKECLDGWKRALQRRHQARKRATSPYSAKAIIVR
ncbi:MAG: Glycerol kinase (EC [uncultured Paraburkholderia sp.]|nr:MAG: Glycerol kinase (EC [uncultured Paraburkholderia sp.]